MNISYLVQPGDTLWKIAKDNNCEIAAIKQLNNLTSDAIYPDQILLIPSSSEHISSALPDLATALLPSVEGGFQLPEGQYSRQDILDIELLAKLVFAEARGEPFDGQIAVAAVVLNRQASPEFPSTIREIIYQPGQFETVANGTINLTPDFLAYQAVLEAREGNDPTEGALFFWNPQKVSARSWVWTLTVLKQIGQHVFA